MNDKIISMLFSGNPEMIKLSISIMKLDNKYGQEFLKGKLKKYLNTKMDKAFNKLKGKVVTDYDSLPDGVYKYAEDVVPTIMLTLSLYKKENPANYDVDVIFINGQHRIDDYLNFKCMHKKSPILKDIKKSLGYKVGFLINRYYED